MTRRKQKLVKYNPTLQRPVWSQKGEPASIPFTRVRLDNFRPKDIKAWRVPGDDLSWLNYRQAGTQSQRWIWKAFLTVMLPFLYHQHQLVVAAEAVKLGSLRRLLGNGWNIHKLQSTQGQWSWPETSSKQKKTLRVIFKLTIPLCREMIHSLLPFYHTCP